MKKVIIEFVPEYRDLAQIVENHFFQQGGTKVELSECKRLHSNYIDNTEDILDVKIVKGEPKKVEKRDLFG